MAFSTTSSPEPSRVLSQLYGTKEKDCIFVINAQNGIRCFHRVVVSGFNGARSLIRSRTHVGN